MRLIISLFLFLCCFSGLIRGQEAHIERSAVKAVISQLFDGMRAGDSSQVRATFAPGATLASSFVGKQGQPRLKQGSVDRFVEMVGQPHDEVYDEKIWSYDINIDGTLATAWTDYTFYLGDKMLHCGVNNFVLHKFPEGWKIVSIVDTRRKTGCMEKGRDVEAELNQLLDAWHRAAATADAAVYFGSIQAGGIYIGTDATELWTKEEFEDWSKKYFERSKAWDFTASDRNIYLAENGRFAWFDELLDTWMGPCRASGVLSYLDGQGWKISHYQLSVTIPNEKIKAFIELQKE